MESGKGSARLRTDKRRDRSVNDALVATPSLANSDPYGAGWVARMRPFDWESDVADLVTGPEGIELYRQFLDAEGITCD